MPWHILYLEPSSGMRRAMALAWLGEPARVSAVADLAGARLAAAELPVDLVLVAASATGSQTIALCAAVRQSCASSNPVVAVVAHATTPTDTAMLARCGATGRIDKPLQVAAMLEQVRPWLASRRPLASRAAVWQGPPPAAPAAQAAGGANTGLARPTFEQPPPPAPAGTDAPGTSELQAMARQAVEAAAWQLVPGIAETLVRRALEARAKA